MKYHIKSLMPYPKCKCVYCEAKREILKGILKK